MYDREDSDARTWCYARPRGLFRTTMVNRIIIWFLLDCVIRITRRATYCVSLRARLAVARRRSTRRRMTANPRGIRQADTLSRYVESRHARSLVFAKKKSCRCSAYNRSYVFVTFACTQLLVYICYIFEMIDVCTLVVLLSDDDLYHIPITISRH